jgi:hypothetical protein
VGERRSCRWQRWPSRATCSSGSSAESGSCCRRYRREARTALPSSLANAWSSPTRDCARACCPSLGELQALESAMSAGRIGFVGTLRPGKTMPVAPRANRHVRQTAARLRKQRRLFDSDNTGWHSSKLCSKRHFTADRVFTWSGTSSSIWLDSSGVGEGVQPTHPIALRALRPSLPGFPRTRY